MDTIGYRLLVSCVTRSAEQTRQRGAELAEALRPGEVLCLAGDLGAGKTTFVEGLARALGVVDPVCSPTFTLENRYSLPGGYRLVHVDLYRADGRADVDLLESLREEVEEGAWVVVEWGDDVAPQLGASLRVEITLQAMGAQPDARRLVLAGPQEGWPALAGVVRRWRGEGEA